LFAISRRDKKRLEKAWSKKFPKVGLTRIGSLVPQSAINASPARTNPQLKSGYVHFQ
jgi:hypothetical protein